MYQSNYLARKLREASLSSPDKIFIENTFLKTKLSYQDFFHNCEKIAQVLLNEGVQPGDRVLNYTVKTVSSLELYVGTILAGAVYVPINPAYIEVEDLAYFIENVEPAIIVCMPESQTLLTQLSSRVNVLAMFTLAATQEGTLIDAKNQVDLAGFVAVERKAIDDAAILYTSGTTGRPKGAVHTHGSLASNAEVLVDYWQFTSQDVLIHVLPIFHLHGLFTATNVALYSGCSMIYMPDFDRDEVLKIMPLASVLMGVPPFYTSLLQDNRLPIASKSMRLFLSGSAPMLPQTHEQWAIVTGSYVLERYGMTECSMIASNPYDYERRPNTVGFALPQTSVRIVEPATGQPVVVGEIGMVEIAGPSLFSGYWRLPEKTAEDMRADGYFISGDYGRYDADGYLHIIGRAKDAILTAKGIVFPKGIEALIDRVVGVAESAVIGVPLANRDNGAIAVVVLSGEAEVDETLIINAIGMGLSEHERPIKVIFVTFLPRNVMGKVQKVALREQYKNIFCQHVPD